MKSIFLATASMEEVRIPVVLYNALGFQVAEIGRASCRERVYLCV